MSKTKPVKSAKGEIEELIILFGGEHYTFKNVSNYSETLRPRKTEFDFIKSGVKRHAKMIHGQCIKITVL